MKQKLLRKTKRTRSTHWASWTLPRILTFRDTWRVKISVRIAVPSACGNAFSILWKRFVPGSLLFVDFLCMVWSIVVNVTYRNSLLGCTHWTDSGLLNKCTYFLFLAICFPYQRHEPRPVKYMGALDCRLILKFSQTCSCNYHSCTVLGAIPS